MNNGIFTKPWWCSGAALLRSTPKPLLGEANLRTSWPRPDWKHCRGWPQKKLTLPKMKECYVTKKMDPVQKGNFIFQVYDFQGIIKKEKKLLEDASLAILTHLLRMVSWNGNTIRFEGDWTLLTSSWQYDRMPRAWSTPMKSKHRSQ